VLTPAQVAACRAALAAGDAKELRLQAHALKSTAAALCVNSLRGVRPSSRMPATLLSPRTTRLTRAPQRCLELERSSQAQETSAGWPAQVGFVRSAFIRPPPLTRLRLQVDEIADAISHLDLTWRWVRSLGAAERAAAFESVRAARAGTRRCLVGPTRGVR
jgi:HPt (histidine-containing phosphotransfer) domain-containing protein